MENNLNLCELLKGHEGEEFYSSVYGSVVLIRVNDSSFPIVMRSKITGCYFTSEGKLYHDDDSECVLFPSKEQRDWNKWVEEQKPKVPKTFDEIPLAEKDYFIRNIPNFELSKIQKSALALLKIHQLIKVGYGGNVNNSDINNQTAGINPYLNIEIKEGYNKDFRTLKPLLFGNTKLAKEFLSYPENVQLIKDLYMIEL